MSVEGLKQSLHAMIEEINDGELLAAYVKIIASGKPFSGESEELSEQEKHLIQLGLTDSETGQVLSHEAVMKEVNELLRRST